MFFLGVLMLDQASKYIVQQIVPVTMNHGISFGVLPFPVATLLVIIFLLACFFFFARYQQKISPIVSGVFLGGAVSNLLDRLVFGGVRDWMAVPFLGLRNNLADWGIFVASMILILSILPSSNLFPKHRSL